MKRLFLSGIFVNLFVMLVNFVTGVISARDLGPVGRGILAEAMRWPSLLIILFTMGLPGAVIYLGKSNAQNRSEYLGAYLVVGSVLGAIGGLVGCSIVFVWFHGRSDAFMVTIILGMLTIPVGVLADGLVGTLQSLEKYQEVMILRAIVPFGNLVLILLLVLLHSYDPLHYMLFSVIWGIATFALSLFWVMRSVIPAVGNVWTRTKELMSKGIQIYAGSITSVFGGNLDQLLISVFLSPGVLGRYAVSSSIASILPSVVIGTFAMFLWPKLMDIVREERLRRFEALHSSVFFSICLITVIAIVALPITLPVLYGAQYKTCVLMAQLLLLGAPFSISYSMLLSLLSTYGRFNVAAVAEGTAVILVCVIFLCARSVIGPDAAALGVTVAMVGKWIIALIACRQDGLSLQGSIRVIFKQFSLTVRSTN